MTAPKSPLKSYRVQLNLDKENILTSPTTKTPSRAKSEPGCNSVKRSLSYEEVDVTNKGAKVAEILFSPTFNKKSVLRRSYTSIGCSSIHASDEDIITPQSSVVPIPLSGIDNSEEDSEDSTSTLTLRTDEKLDDDISDSESIETIDLNNVSFGDEDVLIDYQEVDDPSQFDHDLDS